MVLGPMAGNGSLHVEEANGVGFEALLGRFVALDVGESGNAVPLQAAMQGRARESRIEGWSA
jgi:hypothetical protein